MPLEGALTPDWPAGERVGALMSTRAGGVSAGPWAALNLGGAVGDGDAAVEENRRRFEAALGVPAVYLRQVHGAAVLRLRAGAQAPAHACRCRRHHRRRRRLHGTRRRLPAGAVCRAATGAASAPRMPAGAAWPAACSKPPWRHCARRRPARPANCSPGSGHASDRASSRSAPMCSRPLLAPRISCPGRARTVRCAGWPICPGWRVSACGRRAVANVSGGAWCTVEDASRFFSFRRDGVTGRMAAAVWLRR